VVEVNWKEAGIMKHDPRDGRGEFGELFKQIRACKLDNDKCPNLGERRGYYFEPNQETASEWKAEGMFESGIDRRVVFVGESPGRSGSAPQPGEVGQCFWDGKHDDRFCKVRWRHGFQNCYLTNTVKCGVRKGRRHAEDEINNCIHFLAEELKLIRPAVVVCIGRNAWLTVRAKAAELQLQGQPFYITHHSFRGGESELLKRWDEEFKRLRSLI